MDKIYFDHHTATRPHSAAINAWLPFVKERWGSTASCHEMGHALHLDVEKSTAMIRAVLGANASDVFHFFSSNAEAIEHLYFSHYFDCVRKTGKNHILTTNIEEAPSLLSLKRLEELGCSGKILPVNAQGQLTVEILQDAIRPRTSLVSLSWANALTGVVHPIADLAEVCHAKGVKLHVDASYVLGKLYLRFEDLPIDFLTFEGNVVHAPKGTAGLLTKAHSMLPSPMSAFTGLHVGGMSALAAALHQNEQLFDHVCLETARLRDKLESGVCQGVPQAQVLFREAERLPQCTCIAFPGMTSEALLYLLHRKGIYASVGGGRCQRLFHLLLASGVDERLAQSAVSFSLSYDTGEKEIDRAISIIVDTANVLRSYSEGMV